MFIEKCFKISNMRAEVREFLLSFGTEFFFLSVLSKNTMIMLCRTIILRFVWYGSETRSPTLRAERRLSVFEYRVLRRIFEPKRDEVTGEWRKLRN